MHGQLDRLAERREVRAPTCLASCFLTAGDILRRLGEVQAFQDISPAKKGSASALACPAEPDIGAQGRMPAPATYGCPAELARAPKRRLVRPATNAYARRNATPSHSEGFLESCTVK